jgi:predicted TIM-barrel fold metal-dependent hydrolase
MIVDVHTRVWDNADQLGRAEETLRRRPSKPWQRPDASPDAHNTAMDPVSHALVLGFDSDYLGASITHEQVASYICKDPEKYLGIAGIDPTRGDAVKSLERARALGLVGVTVSPAAQACHPCDTRAMELYEACQAMKFPVLFEAATLLARDAKLEFAQPYLLDEVARTFPELKIVVTSLGNPWVHQCLTLLDKHPTVYADLSDLSARPWQLYNALILAHQQNATERILFGSNYPFCEPEKAMVSIYSINTFTQGTPLPSIPREQLRSIIERDTLVCLGLRDAKPSGTSADAPAHETLQIPSAHDFKDADSA